MKNILFKKEYKNLKKGYTLLFAMLISSLVLSIGIAVFNISLKEFRLSAAGRESQFAFYAADTGAECALYWDFQHAAFATTSSRTIQCAGGDVIDPITGSPTTVGGQPLGATYSFRLDFAPEPYCVDVFLTKLPGIPRRTVLESFGRNSCDPTAPDRVERAIRVQY